jgi:hypothetical protein
VTVSVGGEEARVLAAPTAWPAKLWMRWPARRIHWYDGTTGARIVTPGEDGERD